MRTTWNGSLSFGLVTIPVGLAPATKPSARQSDVSFRLLHRECLTPIRQKRWCPTHDREVGADELVKGWEVAKGQYVVVEESELEELERSDDTRSIEISGFVPLGEVDPVFFDRTYFLVPGSAAAQRRPYRLLVEAMQEAGVGALGRLVRSGRESLCLVRARGDALVLETLFVVEDVHSQAEIDEAMGDVEVKEPELDLARQLVAGMTGAAASRSCHSAPGNREVSDSMVGLSLSRSAEKITSRPSVTSPTAHSISYRSTTVSAGGSPMATSFDQSTAEMKER